MRKHLSAYTSLPSTSQITDFIQGIATPISGICPVATYPRTLTGPRNSSEMLSLQRYSYACTWTSTIVLIGVGIRSFWNLIIFCRILDLGWVWTKSSIVFLQLFKYWLYGTPDVTYSMCSAITANMISKLPTWLMMHVWFLIDNVPGIHTIDILTWQMSLKSLLKKGSHPLKGWRVFKCIPLHDDHVPFSTKS